MICDFQVQLLTLTMTFDFDLKIQIARSSNISRTVTLGKQFQTYICIPMEVAIIWDLQTLTLTLPFDIDLTSK